MKKKREYFIKKARESIQAAFKSRDMLLSGFSKTIEVINKTLNQLTEKLEDLYEVYFPEIGRFENREKFVRVVMLLDKKNPDVDALSAIVGKKKAEELSRKAKESLGANLNEKDMERIRELAKEILSMYRLKKRYEAYQEELVKEICPNINEVAGPEIAAKLLAHVGSLKKLGLLPASTIQILGAEKALFKHLRNKRIKPPKHGIIFQHPKIAGSPKKIRGKIARALANKIALAARADAFTGHEIGKELKEKFEKRYKKIISEKGGK